MKKQSKTQKPNKTQSKLNQSNKTGVFGGGVYPKDQLRNIVGLKGAHDSSTL